MEDSFLREQERRIRKRIAHNEQSVRIGRIDAAFKAAKILPAQYAALARIAVGAYGTCIDCEGAIPLERLKSVPSALRCVTCQERAENETK